jgi:PAP2 superfamily.
VVSAPALLVIALPLTVGVATRGWAGFWWGLFAAMCGGVPSALIYAGLRSKPFTDRRDGRRGLRSSLIWLIVALVIASITVLLVFGPPHTMVVTVAITLATVLFLGPITISWKISLHTAVAFASVVVLAKVWPAVPVYAAGTAATALIGWSRVRLGDHTPAQAIYGALAGGFIAWLTIYWLGWG